MRRPQFRTKRLSRFCFGLDRWLSTWYMRYFALPLAGAIPLGVIATLLSSGELLKKLNPVLTPAVLSWLEAHQIPLILLVALLLGLAQGLRHLITKLAEPDCEVNQDEMVAVFDALYEVVNTKSRTLLKATPEALEKKWKHAKLYRETIQPEQQLVRLVAAINGVFEYLTNNQVSFRTGLLCIEDGKPVEWLAFCPNESPPRTSIETLSAPTSAIMQAICKRGIVVIADMQKELKRQSKEQRRCVKGSLADGESASIITLPIYCPNTRAPIYVLSVMGKKGACLNEAHRERYEWLLQHFVVRIILEHHTMLMKQEVDR